MPCDGGMREGRAPDIDGAYRGQRPSQAAKALSTLVMARRRALKQSASSAVPTMSDMMAKALETGIAARYGLSAVSASKISAVVMMRVFKAI